MEFEQDRLFSGREKYNPNRWVSVDGAKYSIVKYCYSTTGGVSRKVTPYYVGYRHRDGERLTKDTASHKECVKAMSKLLG